MHFKLSSSEYIVCSSPHVYINVFIILYRLVYNPFAIQHFDCVILHVLYYYYFCTIIIISELSLKRFSLKTNNSIAILLV